MTLDTLKDKISKGIGNVRTQNQAISELSKKLAQEKANAAQTQQLNAALGTKRPA